MKNGNYLPQLRYDLYKPNYNYTNIYNVSPQMNIYHSKQNLLEQNNNGNNINGYISYSPYLSRNFSTPYGNIKNLDLNQIYRTKSIMINNSPLNSSTSIFNSSYLNDSSSLLNNYQLNSNSLCGSKSISLYSYIKTNSQKILYSPQTKDTSRQYINIGLKRNNFNCENHQNINIYNPLLNANNMQNNNNNMKNANNNIQHINNNVQNSNNIQTINNNIGNNYNINNINEGQYFVNNKKDKIERIEILEPFQKKSLTDNIITKQTFTNNNLGKIKNIFQLSPTQSINDISKRSENEEPKDNFDPSEFTLIKRIGEGTYGKIYLTKWKKNNRKYAMKKEKIKNNQSIKLHKEKTKIVRNFIKKTASKGVIKIYGDSVIRKRNEINYYMLMEIAEKDWEKELFERKKYKQYYTEKELFIIISQLIKTLSLMQKHHITHRDIKPQNVLISKGLYKISDFGEARTLIREGVIISKVRGTELYMSPKLFQGLHLKLVQVNHNTFKSDVFSLGMCIFFASTLSYNNLCDIRELNDMKLIKERLIHYLNGRYSFKLINILYEMLQIEERNRPDFITLEKKYFS
jgi:tRNA A-37 threonylcarbamoyl transferase component Bud32